MNIKRLTPMLWTDKLEETITFYTEILQFTCGEKNTDWGWASLHNGNAEIMLAKPNEHSAFTKCNFTGSFYFEVDDVETIWGQLKDKSEIVYPLESFEWGMREFAIYDNNGYLLQFGENENN